MERLIVVIERRAVPVLTLAALLTIAAAFALRDLKFEHAQEKYEPPPSDAVMRSIERFRAHFGARTLLVAGLEFRRPIGAGDILLLQRVEARLRTVPQVASVFGLPDVRRIAWGSDGPRAVRLLEGDTVADTDVERLRELVQRAPVYGRGLVSSDWRVAGIAVELEREDGAGVEAERARVSQGVGRLLQAASEGRYTVHLTGMPLLTQALQEDARRDVRVFGWLTVAFIVCMLLALFRQWRPTALGVLVASLALIWTLGLLAATGTPMSASLTMLVPLVLVISVASSVHYLAHFFGRSGPADPRERFRTTMRIVLPPSLLTGLTTAAGFLGLAASRLESVRETGLFLAAGILLSMGATSVVLPALLTVRRLAARPRGGLGLLPTRIAHLLTDAVTGRARSIVVAGMLLAAVGVAGATRLRFDANPLRFFGPDAPLRRSSELVDRALGGSLPLEIVVERPRGTLDGLVPAMLRVEDRLRGMADVGFVGSAADFLQMAEDARPRIMPRAYDPVTGRFPAGLWARLAAAPGLRGYVVADSATLALRIATRVRVADSDALRRLEARVEQALAAESLAGASSVTGLVPLLLRTQQYMVRSQVWSFAAAFAIILALILPLVGSWRVRAIAVAVNVLPLVVVLGVMGWCGLSMDIASIMIASIALGIIVDDTIHFLYRYRTCRNADVPVREAVLQTYGVVGVPMVVTSLVLAGGFLILVPSSFQPTSTFGLLSAVTIAAAFVADLVLLPALLVLVGDARQKEAANQPVPDAGGRR